MMAESSSSLLTGVGTLVAQLVPQLSADDPRAERLLQLCLRIVGSRMAGTTHPPSEAAAAEATRRRLVQSGRAHSALTFSELYNTLSRSPDHGGLRQLPAALQLLSSLSGSGTTAQTQGAAGASAALRARQQQQQPPRPVPSVPPLTLSSGAVRAPEPDGPLHDANGAGPRGGKSKGATPRGRRWEASGSEGELGERALVRELLFVLQNIDGPTLKWDDQRDAFVLPSGAKVLPGARQLAGRLAELGWLFRQVTSYVKEVHGAAGPGVAAAAAPAPAPAVAPAGFETVAPPGGGLVAQALRHALQEELDEWYQLLAVLEEQRQSDLTLLQLLVWSTEPLQRLLVMAQLTRGCGHLKGGAMTVAMARQERHGDPAVCGYVCHLLRAACAPLYGMLREWLLRGEITDASGEFFIEERAVKLADLWESRYVLRDAMLPCFLSRELALEILNVGKALNFIRLCCGDTEWALRLGAPLRTRPAAHGDQSAPLLAWEASSAGGGAAVGRGGGGGSHAGGGGPGGRNGSPPPDGSVSATSLSRVEYGRDHELQSVVWRAGSLANAHLLELLMGKFELRAHCANLQQFLLLGKGDFVQSLMEQLSPQLARPANQLHRHHLLSLVETAVRSSAPEAGADATGGRWSGGTGRRVVEEGEQHALLLKHLDVILTKTPGGTGWDAFCLDYQTGSPCEVIFTEAAMRSYRQASTFLWRLKRVEYTLTAVWRKHCTTARLLPKLHRNATMHGAYLLRNEMVHFVYNLQYYLMFEVIETAWGQLSEKLNSANDLEAVISAHGSFLADIERKAMLRRADEEMHLALKALFDSILQFAKAQDVLYMALLEQKAQQKAHAAAVGASGTKGSGWGAAGAVTSVQLGEVVIEKRFVEQLASSAADYRSRFAAFFSLVRRHTSYDLAFLAYRLDFNEYYESLATHREQVEEQVEAPLEATVVAGASPA